MTAGEAAKVKLLCSFGGKILPRPGDSALRYIGGHTRIVTLRRDVSFHDLMLKMSDVLSSPSSSPVVLKYQLPDEDLDSLVTVSCPDDLDNMLEEYDKLLDSSPDGSAKLRVFLFDSPTSPRDHPTPLPLSDPTHRYIHALNMVPDPPTSTLPRKDSGCSTQNSDPPETTASPETFDAPAVTSPPAPSTTDFVPVNPPPVHAPPQEQFGGGYVGYIPNSSQLHYIGSQQYGYVTVATAPPPGSYMPGAQTATKAGLVAAGDVAGGKTLQPLSQLPPLPPFTNLQSVNVDRYGGGGWQQVQLPAHVPQGQGLRMDDCSFCQKVLPHAHSDSLVQVSGSGGAVPVGNLVEEMNPVYHSLRPEDFAGYCAQQHKVVVSVGVPDSVGEQRVEVSASGSSPAVAVAPTVGVYDYSPQILKMPNENERIAMNKAENTNLNPSAFSAGIAGFPVSLDTLYTQATLPGHIRTPIIGDYQLHPQNSPYLSTAQRPLTQDLLMHKVGAVDSNPAKVEKLYAMEPQQPHLHAMQDLLTSKVTAVDSNPAKIDMAHTLDPSFREGGAESLSSHARPVEGMMETLPVSSEMPAMHEQCKTNVRSATSTPRAMNSESPIIVMESRDNTDPVETRELLGNAFISNVILPEASSMKLAEQLPMSTLDMVYMSSVQPTGQPPIPHKRLLGGSNANRLHGGDRRELTSAIPLGNILPDVSTAPSSNSLLPLANASKPNETNIGEVRNPVPRDSLFSDPDPWGIKQVAQGVQATKPVRVASVESLSSRDSGTESHPSPTSESGHATIADKGNTHMVPLDPNRDPLLDLIPPMKESTSTQIKQGLQIATESLAAPVLQPSAPPAPVVPVVLATSGLPINEPGQETYGIQSVHNVVDTQNTFAHDRGHEDGKPKQSDKPNHGFQIAEDIERLQIIKNCDLEELRELGSGTFGTVYHGKWRGTDVAIKRISDRCFAGKPSDQERMRNDFWNEACNLADLHHPNVVAFYGVVRDGPGGSVATVTEFMVNGSLRNALQRNDKTLDMRKRLLIAMDVAFGMEYLHGKKIVHFDLKSDNLLVNLRDPHRPICKVGDLGLSKVKCQTLISGGVRGTLPWMAPELLSGDSNLVSEKVDVFSFGIVMWELLTGEEPYADLHYGAIIGGIVSNTLRPPIPESCDPEWRSLMEKCWSSEPLERPSFTEVAARLRVVAASYPRKVQPHPNPSTSSPMQK